MLKFLLICGAILSGSAVAAGAIGSHILESRFAAADPDTAQDRLDNWSTAARYQTYHGLAMLVLASILKIIDSRLIRTAGFMFLLGCILFSGMLYAYSLTQIKFLVVFVS